MLAFHYAYVRLKYLKIIFIIDIGGYHKLLSQKTIKTRMSDINVSLNISATKFLNL